MSVKPVGVGKIFITGESNLANYGDVILACMDLFVQGKVGLRGTQVEQWLPGGALFHDDDDTFSPLGACGP